MNLYDFITLTFYLFWAAVAVVVYMFTRWTWNLYQDYKKDK